jgi:hypothetical protein
LFLQKVQLSSQLPVVFFNPQERHVLAPDVGNPIMDAGDGLERPADDPPEWTSYRLKHSLELAGQQEETEDKNDS